MCGRGYSVTLKSIPSYIVSLKSLTSGFEYTGLLDKERVRNSKDIFFHHRAHVDECAPHYLTEYSLLLTTNYN